LAGILAAGRSISVSLWNASVSWSVSARLMTLPVRLPRAREVSRRLLNLRPSEAAFKALASSFDLPVERALRMAEERCLSACVHCLAHQECLTATGATLQ
jgi:hypothetical protein